jgi:hypothetical protein
MVQQLPKLTHFTCVDSDTPPYPDPEDAEDCEFAHIASCSGSSPLLVLWVPRLSATALSSVFALCPNLGEILHTAPAEPEFLTALAASSVKSVGFSWVGVSRDLLAQFRDLQDLCLWDIGPGAEKALVSLAARCPWLDKLTLFFKQRPSLCLFLDVLRHTPALSELNVEGPEPDDADYGVDGERGEDRHPEYEELVADAKNAVCALVRALCPDCHAPSIKL